jgi:hypothetical protein
MKLLVIVFLRSLSLDDEQMAASFQALHATLAPGGKVSLERRCYLKAV